MSREDGAAALLRHAASEENSLYCACFALYRISAFALAVARQPNRNEPFSKSKVSKSPLSSGTRPPFDPIATLVRLPSTELGPIVQPRGSCYRVRALSKRAFSRPASASLLFHEQLMNADGAAGDAAVLLQGSAPLGSLRRSQAALEFFNFSMSPHQ